MVSRALALGLFLILASCAHKSGRGESPSVVVRQYVSALERGDYHNAYRLMSPEFRKRHSRESFAKMMGADQHRVRKWAQRVAGEEQSVLVEARLSTGGGETLRVVRGPGGWRIGEDPIAFYGQDTPRTALRSFIRAASNQRYDVMLRFVPKRWAKRMTAEKLRRVWLGPQRAKLEHMIATLRKNAASPIHTEGDDRATMPYANRLTVRFLREDGVWKIEDPD